jgi:hypothetical protein
MILQRVKGRTLETTAYNIQKKEKLIKAQKYMV